jgi:type I restriction enzyme S subunit
LTEGAPNLDLRPDHWAIVRDILAAEIPERAVLAFGSRARWTAKAHSDLDLAILGDGPQPLDRMAALREAFEDSDLPFKVDLVDLHGVEARFREAIRREAVTVQQGAEARAPTPPTCGSLGMADEWTELTLADACISIDYGLTASASEHKVGPKFLRITDIGTGHIDWDAVPHVTADKVTAAKYRLHDGDVVLARTGASTGASAYVRNPPAAVFASYLVRLKAKPEFEARFLAYYLRSNDFWTFIRGVLGDKSAQPNASASTMTKAPLRAPKDKSEQRAIAHILGTLDDRIEANRRMAATLEEMARALFRAWFVTFEPVRAKAEGRWRPGQTLPGLPASLYDTFPDRLVETEHGEIPEGWRHGRLGDFTELQNGYAFKSSEWQTAGTPVVKIGSVKPSVVDLKQVSFVTTTLANDRSAFQLKVGDVLVGLTGYVGETGRVPPTANPPMLNQRVGRFSSSGTFSPFVYACVRQPEFKQYAESKAHGSAQPNVSTKDLLDYPVTASNNVVLRSFEGLVAPIFQKSLANFGEIAALSETRDFLLPRLMSGEVRVKDAEAFLKARGL